MAYFCTIFTRYLILFAAVFTRSWTGVEPCAVFIVADTQVPWMVFMSQLLYCMKMLIVSGLYHSCIVFTIIRSQLNNTWEQCASVSGPAWYIGTMIIQTGAASPGNCWPMPSHSSTEGRKWKKKKLVPSESTDQMRQRNWNPSMNPIARWKLQIWVPKCLTTIICLLISQALFKIISSLFLHM